MERQPGGGLKIRWDDGHQSVYSPGPLRLACRCAHCEDEWSGERRLSAASIPADLTLVDSKPVGRYGLQFVWSDGHSTGIYTFERLRSLCECASCRGSRPR